MQLTKVLHQKQRPQDFEDFFKGTCQEWLQQAANVMGAVSTAELPHSLVFRAGPAPVEDVATDEPEISFQHADFPGAVSDGLGSILHFIKSEPLHIPGPAPDQESFGEVLERASSFFTLNPQGAEKGNPPWVKHEVFLAGSLRTAQQALVEHDRALALMQLWRTDNRGRPASTRGSVEQEGDALTLQLRQWFADAEAWEAEHEAILVKPEHYMKRLLQTASSVTRLNSKHL